MFNLGDYVIPTFPPNLSVRNSFFHPKYQPFGIILSVDKKTINTRRKAQTVYTVLQLYGNPYASDLGPTYTWVTSSFYKIDKGKCRKALEMFILSPTTLNAEKVHALARQYDRFLIQVPEHKLRKVHSFQEALDTNAHFSIRHNNTTYVTYERFIQERTRDITSLLMLNQFEEVFVPSLRL